MDLKWLLFSYLPTSPNDMLHVISTRCYQTQIELIATYLIILWAHMHTFFINQSEDFGVH